MKVIVTGAHGFIGEHLSKRLMKNGYQVAAMPRETLLNPYEVEAYVQAVQPDYIFHLASYGNHSNQTDLDEIVTTNIIKTYFLLKAAKNTKLKGFITFGSSSEYGTSTKEMKESDILAPTTLYGATKASATHLTQVMGMINHIPTLVIRPFSVYGEGEADFRFIPTVITSVLESKTLTLDPTPCHDWIYIEDFTDGVLKGVENIKELNGKVLNIGTGEQYSNREVVEAIEKVACRKIETLPYKNKRSYDSPIWVADNSLLVSLGWNKKYSLAEGLLKTYEYYKKQRLEETYN